MNANAMIRHITEPIHRNITAGSLGINARSVYLCGQLDFSVDTITHPDNV